MATGVALEGKIPERENVDVFLLYNEKERQSEIGAVAEGLEAEGLSVHYSRRDISAGAPFKEIEAQMLRGARGVVVLLGGAGWGPTQVDLAEEAQTLGKLMLPVLIGEPSRPDLDAARGLFRDHLYVDVRKDDAAIRRIAEALRQSPPPDRLFDQTILTLIDGKDIERAILLERMERGVLDPAKLAARLRDLVHNEFGPDQEERAERGMRDSRQFASIRSWMLSAIIRLDPHHADSRDLLLRHLDPNFEHERTVRFWCLGGLIQRKPAYLDEALHIAIEDPSSEVADLASAASNPHDPELIDKLRRDLDSETFATARHVLRLLRIIPLPELTLEVCAQLERTAQDTPLTYDVLFALANPDMAHAAREALLERPGLDRLAALVLEESRSSNAIAMRSFARFLTIFDRAATRQALDATAESDDDQRIARDILRYMAEVDRRRDEALFIPGYASDTIDVSKDDIGIALDVETLTAVMLAREVEPPLAIGLFGAWGSGKSFFMRSIQVAAERMARRARETEDSRFCGNIVQINFNAWHYSDANLWASLVSHILDQLSVHVVPGASPAQQQARLEVQLDSTMADLAAAKADRERAKQAVDKAQKTLGDLRVERERKEIRLCDLRASEFAKLLADDQTLKTELTAALNRVGAPAVVASAADLDRILEESYSTAGRASALLAGLLKGQSRSVVITIVVVLLVAPIVFGALVRMIGSGQLSSLSATTAQMVTLLGAAAVFMRNGLSYARNGLETLSSAKNRVDALLAAKRAEPSAEEIALEREIARARAGEQEASERLTLASAQAVDLENRVAALKESQSLGFFLTERTSSEDYRRHLGLISVIRKDFETLVMRLQAPSDANQTRVDRIVLYIDDLDRCPSNMVIDVLQAVHLLLAYPLFVVVVSVDPRWLLRSLEMRFRHFRHGGAEMTDSWAATPQDYLEKIFQIPFSVRPMGDRGFSRLMDRLLTPETDDRQQQLDDSASRDPDSPPTEAATEQRSRGAPGTDHVQQLSSTLEQQPEEPPTGQDIEILEEALIIREVESQFAGRLHRFIPTPRAAKRFANIYRLLKAPVGRDQLQRHEGTIEIPGEFRLPMLLLALLIGHPDEAALLFPQFLARAREMKLDFWACDEPNPGETPEISELREEIAGIAGEWGFPNDPQLVTAWLPKVARFSFVTARLAAEE